MMKMKSKMINETKRRVQNEYYLNFSTPETCTIAGPPVSLLTILHNCDKACCARHKCSILTATIGTGTKTELGANDNRSRFRGRGPNSPREKNQHQKPFFMAKNLLGKPDQRTNQKTSSYIH